MKIKKYPILTPAQKSRLLELWNAEYPAQLAHSGMESFQTYLDSLIRPEHYLLETETGEIKGWYLHFTRDAEKWFAIILAGDIQRQGFGAALLAEAKMTETELNGWVTDRSTYRKRNGEVYLSPLGFYLKNGFVALEERLELEVLSAVKIRWRK